MPALLAALLLAAEPVSLEFNGSLGEGLKALANKSELNLVVIGDFDEQVQLHLNDINPEVALEGIATAYGLEVARPSGASSQKMWIIRRASQDTPAPARVEQEKPARKVERKGRNRVSTGAPVIVESGSRVDTAVAYGGPVIIEEDAAVDGDAVAFGGDVILKKGAIVEGDAVSFGGNVVRDEDSTLGGESISMGGASIAGKVARGVLQAHNHEHNHEHHRAPVDGDEGESSSFGSALAVFLLKFAFLFGLGFLMMWLAPQRMQSLESAIRAEPGKNGLIGLLGLITIVFATIVLVLTVVGIPAAMLAWTGLAFFLPVGVAVVAHTLGTKLPMGPLKTTQALVLAAGLLLVLLVETIPYVGQIVFAGIICVAAGAVLRTRFGQTVEQTPFPAP